MRKPIIRSNVNPLALPQLFFAGRAVLTFRNTVKETHMTVKVKQATDKNDRKIKLPIFFVFVSLLGDKETGYVFAATIFKDTMGIKLSKNVQEGTQLHKVVSFIWNSIRNPQILKDKKVSLLHEGRCCRCAMPLTHPESINTGFGPDCLEYILAANKDINTEFFMKVEKDPA
jgi:hypothetical protein